MTSQSSQNSTTFNIFGDSIMEVEQQPTVQTASDNSDSSELKEKISKLQETIARYEVEVSTYKAGKNEFNIKLEKVKSDLDSKTKKCDKMENEINKVHEIYVSQYGWSKKYFLNKIIMFLSASFTTMTWICMILCSCFTVLYVGIKICLYEKLGMTTKLVTNYKT